jgi:hypothetical protein
VKGGQVVVVETQSAPELFFGTNREEFGNKRLGKRPRGGLESHVRRSIETYPVLAPFYLTVPPRSRRKLSPYLWSEIRARHEGESLRQLAKEYGASREAVRRILEASTSSP